jgi:hypothetical protein
MARTEPGVKASIRTKTGATVARYFDTGYGTGE